MEWMRLIFINCFLFSLLLFKLNAMTISANTKDIYNLDMENITGLSAATQILSSFLVTTETSSDISLFDTTDNSTFEAEVVKQGEEVLPAWVSIVDKFQLVMTCIGFSANILTFITLFFKGDPYSPCIRLLIQHQAVLDSWVCGIGIIILVQPFMWTTGISGLDLVICHVWHSQGVYWGALWLSIWNLVVFGIERYLAVCKPFAHQHMRRYVIRYVFPLMYFVSVAFLIPVYLQVRYYNNSCHSEYFSPSESVEHFMKSYGTIWFAVSYATPCALYTFFYGNIILTFRKRSASNFTSTSTIEKANAQLTNTAIVVTIVFIIALGFDSWYYMLGSLNITEYVYNSPMQKVGVFFSIMNSVVNPFVYAFSMPIFRICIMRTFCPCLIRRPRENNSTDSAMTQVSVAVGKDKNMV